MGCTQVQGALSFAAGYIGRVGEAQRCLEGSLYLFVSQEAEELTFFDMPWVLAIDILHFVELLKIESSDKRKTSQECEGLYYGKFLLTKTVDFTL